MAVSLGINITPNSQNIAERSSNITVSVYCWWSGGSYNINSPGPPGWLSIDGVRYDFRNTFNDNRTTSGSKTLFSKTLDVVHDSEGVKTVNCSAYFATGVSSGNITASNSLRLPDIPRYARVVEAEDFTDEENPVITYANYAGDATTSIQAAISIDGKTPLVAYRTLDKNAESYTFRLTDAERNSLRSASVNSNDLPVFFLMRTSIGSDTGVTDFSVVMHIVNAEPVVNPVVVDTNDVTVAVTRNNSILVAMHSIAKVTLNALAQKGASIKSKKVEQEGVILTGDGVFLVTSTAPIVITVEDSRGNVTTIQTDNQFVPYIDPMCIIEHTMPDGEGEMPLTVTGKAYNGMIGSTTNAITVQYRNKSGYGEYGEWVTIKSVIRTGNDFVAKTIVTGLDYKSRHTFEARVVDLINTNGVFSTEQVFVSVPVFDWGPEDFRFNVPVTAEKVTGLLEPENDSDAVNKSYVDAKNNAIKEYANSKIGMVLLWENDSPTESFPARTVELDLQNYEAVVIEFGETWQTSLAYLRVGRSGSATMIGDVYTATSGYFYVAQRDIYVTTDGVRFSTGFHKYANKNVTEENNSNMIPYKIFGIKGLVNTIPFE